MCHQLRNSRAVHIHLNDNLLHVCCFFMLKVYKRNLCRSLGERSRTFLVNKTINYNNDSFTYSILRARDYSDAMWNRIWRCYNGSGNCFAFHQSTWHRLRVFELVCEAIFPCKLGLIVSREKVSVARQIEPSLGYWWSRRVRWSTNWSETLFLVKQRSERM